MPMVSPGGVNQAEMASVVSSDELQFSSLLSGDVVNMPFRALQKLCVLVFGLSSYTVKLPAIIIGLATGILLVLLLNRWFKTNVAMIASGFVAMSAFFLSETGLGTPNIMVIFWMVLMLWLGAKLVGSKVANMPLLISFFATLALACYYPFFIYIVILIGIVGFFQPHLRFFLKNYKRVHITIAMIVFGVLLLPLLFGAIVNNDTLRGVLFGGGGDFLLNVENAFMPFFFFSVNNVGGVLAPFFGLATVAVLLVGLVASVGKINNAKNAIAVALVLYAIVMSGFEPVMATVLFLPILLLVANGIEYTINKWYNLFPENPYARLFGVFPIALFSVIALVSGVSHFFFGYQYVAPVANELNDVDLVREHLPTGGILLVGGDELNYRFYKLLERKEMVTVSQTLPDRTGETIVTVAGWKGDTGLPLADIITSPKATNSDRLYIYKQEN